MPADPPHPSPPDAAPRPPALPQPGRLAAPALLAPALLALALLLPLGLAWALVGPARPWRDELAGAAGLLGFAALLWSFVLSGRFRLISDRLGMDRTMRWHRAIGVAVAVLLLLLHPFLYSLPDGPAFARPDDLRRAGSLGLSGWALASGMLAWLLLGLLVLTALARDMLPFRYEAWRAAHGLLALAVAGLGLHHALEAGRYSAAPALAWLWAGLTALSVFSLLWVWLLRPLALARRPWRIAALAPAAERIWELVLEPVGHAGLRFKPGQFVWLKLDTGPFGRREHPFSIASAPSEDRLRFLVKEAGDFTSRIGALPVGARAHVDGPHGHLVAEGRPEPGIAFLCGGVGVAPALSLIRAEVQRPDPRPMLLIYGNRHAGQMLARAELEGLAAAGRLDFVPVLGEPPPGWTGETGQLDAALIARRCAGAAAAGWLFVLCGPPPMLGAARRALRGLGVPAARILEERFSYG